MTVPSNGGEEVGVGRKMRLIHKCESISKGTEPELNKNNYVIYTTVMIHRISEL